MSVLLKEENKEVSSDALSGSQKLAIILTGLVVFILWAINLFALVAHKSTSNDFIGDRGTFGDMFGAVNALFSGLAFGGIIWTILLQRNELKLQREESQMSRNEAIDQNKTLRQQRFENTFFNMLNLQNEIVKNLKLPRLEGRQVIYEAKKDLYTYLNWENFEKVYDRKPHPGESLFEVPQGTSNARAILDSFYYGKYYNRYASHFNHYFRHLYHIYKFIFFSGLSEKDQKFYSSLIRAQLSQDELFLLSFNMLIDGYGKPNMLFLIREFDILQNFDWSDVHPEVFKNLMEKELRDVSYPFEHPRPQPQID